MMWQAVFIMADEDLQDFVENPVHCEAAEGVVKVKEKTRDSMAVQT